MLIPDSVIEACIQPLSDDSKRGGLEDCTICLDSMGHCHDCEADERKEVGALACGHVFHKGCVKNWLRLSLP